MSVTEEEARYFQSLHIKQITRFMDANDDKCIGQTIGIKQGFDADYVWYRKSHTYLTPKCDLCGRAMVEGTIQNPEGLAGFPRWFCKSKSCAEMTGRRIDQKIEAYRTGKGPGLASESKKTMNIPIGFHDRTLKTLTLNNKPQVLKIVAEGNSLFVTGKTGSGKTHLAVALLIECGYKSPAGYRFENVPEIYRRIESVMKSEGNYSELVTELISYGVLVLDDLGATKTSDFRKEIIYEIINGREMYKRQTIVTTNLDLQQIRDVYGERLASRMLSYIEVRMEGKDKRGLNQQECGQRRPC